MRKVPGAFRGRVVSLELAGEVGPLTTDDPQRAGSVRDRMAHWLPSGWLSASMLIHAYDAYHQ